jgi:hypothetical protein
VAGWLASSSSKNLRSFQCATYRVDRVPILVMKAVWFSKTLNTTNAPWCWLADTLSPTLGSRSFGMCHRWKFKLVLGLLLTVKPLIQFLDSKDHCEQELSRIQLHNSLQG